MFLFFVQLQVINSKMPFIKVENKVCNKKTLELQIETKNNISMRNFLQFISSIKTQHVLENDKPKHIFLTTMI